MPDIPLKSGEKVHVPAEELQQAMLALAAYLAPPTEPTSSSSSDALPKAPPPLPPQYLPDILEPWIRSLQALQALQHSLDTGEVIPEDSQHQPPDPIMSTNPQFLQQALQGLQEAQKGMSSQASTTQASQDSTSTTQQRMVYLKEEDPIPPVPPPRDSSLHLPFGSYAEIGIHTKAPNRYTVPSL